MKLLFNEPLWSLVLEMYFYLCFPLLLLLIKPINSLRRVIAAFIAGYLLQFALIQLYLPGVETLGAIGITGSILTNPVIRGIEFLFGMLMYKAFVLTQKSSDSRSIKLLPSVVSVAAYVSVIHFASNYIPYVYHIFFVELPFIVIMVYALLKLEWYPGKKITRLCTP